MTIEQSYNEYISQLANIYDKREAANVTDWVFENITGLKKTDRNINKQQELSNESEEQLHRSLQELLQHKPVQYVLGEAWFYKMNFHVNEYVLIPRPETEELVEWVVEDVRSTRHEIRGMKAAHSSFTLQTLSIIDIGTGSACIGIALKKELNNVDVLGIDVSNEALAVAKRNAEKLNAHIDFFQVDFLNEKNWDRFPSFDIIVSNPPYIPAEEKNLLDKNVVAYEPHSALFVPDADTFIFYKKIALFAQEHLSDEGKIYVEVHERYAAEVAKIFLQYHFTPVIKKDIYGKERMIKANH
jgi:release factor glutamine methyltransferase